VDLLKGKVKEEAKQEIQSYLVECFKSMPVINELSTGEFPKERVQEIALLHFAETKTFTNIKNPARLYICPHGARHAKQYFTYLYAEEQGNFKEGMHHADLFKPVCYDLGISDKQLDSIYNNYSKNWLHLFHEKPSYEIMIRELGVSVAWESLTPFFGDTLIDSLGKNYKISEEGLKYFKIHYKVDEVHSARAQETLARYCSTPDLMKRAKKGIRSSLIDDLHLVNRYGSIL